MRTLGDVLPKFGAELFMHTIRKIALIPEHAQFQMQHLSI